MSDIPPGATVLDVRGLAKPERHPLIAQAYAALSVGSALVVVNDHEPVHLREEFEAGHPGSHGWRVLSGVDGEWRIRIVKLASAPLPRILVDTTEIASDPGEPDTRGAVWRLEERERHLDANVIALPPGGGIAQHAGPEEDVLLHVLAGSGTLWAELGELELAAGALVWLPRRARRQIDAGPEGLRYMTVHRRKQGLQIRAVGEP